MNGSGNLIAHRILAPPPPGHKAIAVKPTLHGVLNKRQQMVPTKDISRLCDADESDRNPVSDL